MIGPETPAWEFNTPERGWELLDTFMPGVWLYPVLQDPTRIRQFFGGSPYGQVDLVPDESPSEKLSKYRLLVLPGWNTMSEEMYERLIRYVRDGGHLVLSAAQCTKHITRDFLLEKTDFNFLNSGDLTALAGVRLKSVSAPIARISWVDGKSVDAHGLPGLATEITTARALATDEHGNPVLVEHAVGKGRVWLLTVGEYWGAPALDAFRSLLGEKLSAASRTDAIITGDVRDVDCHLYEAADGWRRTALLNTDWTRAGNIKRVTLHTSKLDMPIDVREGCIVQILEKDGFAVAFATPGVICEPEALSGGEFRIRASGVGKAEIRVHVPGGGAGIDIDGRAVHPSADGRFTFDFGERWREVSLRVRLL
jgi:hypothetical protein